MFSLTEQHVADLLTFVQQLFASFSSDTPCVCVACLFLAKVQSFIPNKGCKQKIHPSILFVLQVHKLQDLMKWFYEHVVYAIKQDAHCVTHVQYFALEYLWNLSLSTCVHNVDKKKANYTGTFLCGIYLSKPSGHSWVSFHEIYKELWIKLCHMFSVL